MSDTSWHELPTAASAVGHQHPRRWLVRRGRGHPRSVIRAAGGIILAVCASVFLAMAPPVAAQTLSASPTTVVAGGTVTATWSGIATPTGSDWLGLYVPGTSNGAALSWRYTTGAASGSVPFVLPASLAPGSYELRLLAHNGYTVLATSNSITVGTVTGSLPTVTITASNPSAAEAGALAGTVTVSRTGSVAAALTVTYTVSGRATPGTDYLLLASSLTIPAGASTATLTIVPIDDALVEGNETVTVTLTPTAAYDVGSPASATITITDNVGGGPTLSASPTTVPAGGTATATWSGIATPTPSDWLGLYVPGTSNGAALSWRYTTGAATGSVPFVLPASLAPGSYELRLLAHNSYTSLATSSAITVGTLIVSLPTVTITASNPSAAEAGALAGTVTVSRTGSVAAALTVSYTVSGTATPGVDYLLLAGSLTIPAGASTATLAIVPIGDALVEGNETVTVTLTPTAAYDVGFPASATITITDNVGSGPTLSASPTTVAAGGTVTATWSGIATPTPSDWLGLYVPGTSNGAALSWRYTTGAATGSVPFVLPASLAPGSYELRLLAHNSYTSLATSNAITATAPLPTVTITASNPSAAEAGALAGTLTVKRSGSVATALTVTYTVSGTAIPGTDYVPLAGSLVIPAGASTATLTIVPIDDAVAEALETVVITLNPDAAYNVGTPGTATVTISDDDSPSMPTQGFGSATLGGAAGSLVHVTNLNDSGPGSLREAVATGNRIVVFDIGGEILLTSAIRVTGAFITIDGFTAPSPGITLRGAGLSLQGTKGAHDVIVRGIRVRDATATESTDGITIAFGAYNIVVDHVSICCSADGNLDITFDSHDVTVSWSILAGTGKDMLIKYNPSRVTLHHNLLVHNVTRNPQVRIDEEGGVASDTTVDMRNNLIWDWTGGYGTLVWYGPWVNVVNNFYSSPDNGNKALSVANSGRAYVSGNISAEGANLDAQGTEASPFPAPFVDTQDACTAAHAVLAGAGVRPLDLVDQQFLSPISLPPC